MAVPVKEKRSTGFRPCLSESAPSTGAPKNCMNGYEAIKIPYSSVRVSKEVLAWSRECAGFSMSGAMMGMMMPRPTRSRKMVKKSSRKVARDVLGAELMKEGKDTVVFLECECVYSMQTKPEICDVLVGCLMKGCKKFCC